jgi:hypothetical protein
MAIQLEKDGAEFFIAMDKFILRREIEGISSYIQDNTVNILALQTNLDKEIEREMKRSKEKSYLWYGVINGEHQNYNVLYPSLFHSSMLVWLFSFFEGALNNICRSCENYLQLELGVNDISGKNTLDKRLKYISKVIKIDMSDLDNTWKILLEYYQVRNLIVHRNSNIIDNQDLPITQQKNYNLIFKDAHIELHESTGGFTIKNVNYVNVLLSCIEKYLETLTDRIIIRNNTIKSAGGILNKKTRPAS